MSLRRILLALAIPSVLHAQPSTGRDVLARMRAAYAGKWYRTLTFVQKTTLRRPDGRVTEETWYESLRYTPERGVQLRIDRGDPALGNGTLNTADSTWVLRAGKVVATRGEGNEFLPLIEGVYVQPVERTVREVERMHVDMAKVRADRWEGRPVTVVGAAAGDSTSPQFWIDDERQVLVRMILVPAPNQPPLDVTLQDYRRVGGGWLETKVDIGPLGAAPVQTEEYTQWKADVPLPDALFDVARWTTAPHWAWPASRTTGAIDVRDLKDRLGVVADDSMQGREAGKRGGTKVEAYLAREAARLGLEPAGENGTYFQAIPLVARRPDTTATLRVGADTLRAGRDVLPVPRLGAQPFLGGQPFGGTFDGADVPTVYGGEIGAGELLPVEQARGKLVIFRSPAPAFWQRDNLLRYANVAAGVGVVLWDAAGPNGPPQFLRVAREIYDDPARPWPVKLTVLGLSAQAAERIFGAPLGGQAVGAAGRPVSGKVGFVDGPTEAPARNVVAVLRGSDPKLRNTYVAVGAHHDHVGMTPRPLDHDSIRAYNAVVRPRGADDPPRAATADETARVRALLDSLRRTRPARPDSINNGADDDGSGTVLALEIAEGFVKGRVRPKRSLLFVWHTAEEKGLYGAQFFSDHPTVPRDSIVAQVNMDQMGRGDPEDAPPGGANALVVIGARRLSTELGDLAERVNAKHGFTLDYAFDKDGDPLNAYCRSDHYMYARYGIPVVFYSAAAWHKDYHMVSDETAYIAWDRMARIGRYIKDVVGAVADLDRAPRVDKPKPDPDGGCQQ